MEIHLIQLQNTLYDYIDWITPKLAALETWIADSWSWVQFDPRQIELAAL